jgi:hypothetical protein
MELSLMLSHYLQSREHLRSVINCSPTPEHNAHGYQDRGHLARGVTAPEPLPTPAVPNTAEEDTTPVEVVDLNDAFAAMTAAMKFDWPEFSPTDRIKAGLIESALGLVLFLAMIAATALLHRSLIR